MTRDWRSQTTLFPKSGAGGRNLPVTGHWSLVTCIAATLLCAACAQVPTTENGAVAHGEPTAAPAPSAAPTPRAETPAQPAPVQARAPEPPRPPADIWERM